MAKIIVFGDIDIASLYISIDGDKEVTVSGKHPQSFTISAGTHHIFATTVSKIERVANRFSDDGFMSALTATVQNSTNTTLRGELDFDETDVLLIEVQQKGLKTVVYNKVVSAAEVDEYVRMSEVVEFGTKKRRKWKWLLWLFLVIFGILAVLFLRIFMAEVNVSH